MSLGLAIGDRCFTTNVVSILIRIILRSLQIGSGRAFNNGVEGSTTYKVLKIVKLQGPSLLRLLLLVC